MSAKAPLGLPSITPGLKSITPYLQRAEEIRKQEPIVAYWCAYYAAQLGVGLKIKDAASRNVLIALLGYLEQMKSEIGTSDAIDNDAAGSAYVENFSLRVFSAADNEDRSGRATKATAKKFLVAANFLEVLKTFNNADISESNLEKIRYAKWKAAEIAKAFREGRTPAPGPPGFAEEQEIANQLLSLEERPPDIPDLPAPPSQPAPSGRLSPQRLTSSRERSRTPPSGSPKTTFIPAPHADEWSTIVAPNASILDAGPGIPSRPIPRSNSGGSIGRTSPSGSPKQDHHISGERQSRKSSSRSPKHSPTGSKPSSPTRQGRTSSQGSEKKVHFTPSVIGGSVTTGSQPGSPQQGHTNLPPFHTQPGASYADSLPSPPPPPPSAPSAPYRPEPAVRSPPLRYQPPPPAPAPARVILTPALILQVQKQCRLASSALDYEDAETAKKELRAALALLGD
ncbi:hypothetical protein EST38_g1834 [Candolleomyces aberdarensis]|uniref:DUF605-domain-containing protein n=1 Tax=Candolleomyces aberdarensis TaxID=2316362 RepID=A0A4Q2DWJ8_9AGAR|nr:hypothetical protein EST38_g1834 [Candolleomyces aberdarensis]